MDQEKTGALIARKRKEKGMTQRELAEKLGVSNKAVSRWETGAGFPDVSILERLAEELSITVTALLSGAEEAASEEKLVVESTRQFSKELTDKKKRYRRISIIAVTIIALAAAAILYANRPKEIAILPQQDTVLHMSRVQIKRISWRLSAAEIFTIMCCVLTTYQMWI